MKKIFLVLLSGLFLISCKRGSDLEMYFLLNQENDDHCFLLEKEIKDKINQVENDSLKSKILVFDELTKDYISYIEDITNSLINNAIKDNNETPINDKAFSESKYVNELFFENGKHSLKGTEFLEKTNSYRNQTEQLAQSHFLKEKIKFILNTDNPLNREEKEIDWLEYHFKDFPMIAIVAKLKVYRRDVLQLESEFIDSVLKND